jgi:formate dehydrogenase subunit gamma
MATEPYEPVVRNNRRTRWLHTATYLTTFALLFTGWWLLTGHDGEPSVLARAFGTQDHELHRDAGWVFVGVVGAGCIVGVRGVITFLRETFRVNRGDGRWFARLPAAAFTGRFARHRGHFDPAQRVANLGFVATLGTLIVTGIALTTTHGGPQFVWLVRLHRYSTYALTVLVVVHVFFALGVLPGYRGVWRAMHLGGRVPAATARRLWPASAATASAPDAQPTDRRTSEHERERQQVDHVA